MRADLREAVANGDLEMLRTLAGEDLAQQPPATLELLAVSLARLGDVAGSIDVLRRSTRLHPDDATLHRLLANLLAPSQDDALRDEDWLAFREAIGHAWAAVALQPESPVNLALLGRLHDRLGEPELGLPLLERAVALRPESTFYRFALAAVLADVEGESEQALRELRAAREGGSPPIRRHWSHLFASTILQREGELDAAFEEALAAFEVRRTSTVAIARLVDARLARGELDGVVETFESTAPDTTDALNVIAWSLGNVDASHLDDPEYAVECARRGVAYAEEALRRTPRDANLWNTLSVARLRARDFAGARDAAERSVELSGGSGLPEDWFTLASAHAELGDTDLGRLWYERARAWLAGFPGALQDPQLRRLANEAAERLGLPPPRGR